MITFNAARHPDVKETHSKRVSTLNALSMKNEASLRSIFSQRACCLAWDQEKETRTGCDALSLRDGIHRVSAPLRSQIVLKNSIQHQTVRLSFAYDSLQLLMKQSQMRQAGREPLLLDNALGFLHEGMCDRLILQVDLADEFNYLAPVCSSRISLHRVLSSL
ncbi:MAG: hypothetical protein WCD86_18210 [Ktedonobacteraceae bacterium]